MFEFLKYFDHTVPTPPLPGPDVPEKEALDMIIEFEESGRYAPHPYLDPVKIPTQGYGSIWHWSEDGTSHVRVTMDDPEIDEAEARRWLGLELHDVCEDMAKVITVPLSARQRAALEDFIYNLGSGNFNGSTLLRRLNQGDFEGAANEFLRWNHAGGVELAGLTRRRAAEKLLFEGGPAPC